MQIRITGGRLVDPGHFVGIADILIEDEKIVAIIEGGQTGKQDQASNIQRPGDRIFDASGKIVTPGLIDMHVHLREPGYEYKETIESGCRAAAHGGFSTVCCMPNTNPVNDSRQITEYILAKAVESNLVRVLPIAAISKGIEGKTLCEYEGLKQAGAIALSDDGNPVMDSRLMRRALEKAKDLHLLVISHCEDFNLAAGGVMNEGIIAKKLAIAGIPGVSETIMVLRDIALSELTSAPVHIAHVSMAGSIRAIRDAKARGVRVTAETAPHYFTLTENAVDECGTHAKMNPPLGTESDRAAICEGLADGTIDVIATDHAPHSNEEKALGLASAPNGIIGLETSVSLSLKLVQAGVLKLTQLVEKMCTNPAGILGLECGLRAGGPADITIIDPDLSYTVDTADFRSLSRNTPFDGWHLKGKPVLTMVGGRIVYEYGKHSNT
jgi:dihydroorotase